MVWQNISKPTASAWTTANPSGREQYDQASLTYDDSSVFYDGVNPNMWSDIAKPASPASWVSVQKPS